MGFKSVWGATKGAGKSVLSGGRGLDHIVSTTTVGAVGGAAVGGLTGLASGDGFGSGAFRGAVFGGLAGAGVGGISNFRGKVGSELGQAAVQANTTEKAIRVMAGDKVKGKLGGRVLKSADGTPMSKAQLARMYPNYKRRLINQDRAAALKNAGRR